MTVSHTPRVSTGVPVYNGERYLAETIDSLLAQTFEDFELIICDNASTDRTEEIGRHYAARDPRVRYVRNERNLGSARNYRRALELSSGEYFRWAAHDDICAPEYLARCVEVLDREPSVVLAYPKTKLIEENGQVTSEYEDRLHLVSPRASERFLEFLKRIRLCNVIFGLTRAQVLKKIAPLGTYIGSDIVLLAELTLYGEFWEVPEFLFYRRLHPEASSSHRDVRWLQNFYDPSNTKEVPLTEWTQYRNYFRCVWCAPLLPSEKIYLSYYLLRMANWDRSSLAGELSEAVRQWMRRNQRA